jgi:hypothetical protein
MIKWILMGFCKKQAGYNKQLKFTARRTSCVRACLHVCVREREYFSFSCIAVTCMRTDPLGLSEQGT